MPQQITATGPNGEKLVLMNGQWVSAPAAPSFAAPTIITKRADPKTPLEVQKLQNDLDPTVVAASRDKAVADAAKARAEADKAKADVAAGNGGTDKKVRADAISAYKMAEQMDKNIAQLEKLYQAGPGRTKGLAGLEDYLPFTANQRFDSAGNSLRGDIGQLLGFTGGQLNTATEAQYNVGPYLPQSSDRDAVIEDKIARLKSLRDLARERSIQILGGAPDENGVIHPVSKDKAVAPASAAGGVPPTSGGDVPDGSAPMPGGTSGGDTMSLSQGNYTSKLVPAPKEKQAEFLALQNRNASDDEISKWGQDNGYRVSDYIDARRKNPNVRGTLGTSKQMVPLSGLDAVMNTISRSPVGAAGIGAADAVTGGWLDELTPNPDQTRAVMALSGTERPNSTLAGNLAGGALSVAGMEGGAANLAGRVGLNGARAAAWVPRIADAGYGAISGAGNADNGNRIGGAIIGGIGGAVGGMGGRAIARGVGGALRGVQDAAVKYLNNRGIPLTVGQALSQSGAIGRAAKGFEDRLSGVPGIGDIVGLRRADGLSAFNRAAFDDALAPVGATTGGEIGPVGVDLANDAVDNAYGNALRGVTVAADAPFGADYSQALRAGNALPDPMRGNARYTLDTRVGNSFTPNGDLTGNGIQQSIRGLRQDASNLSSQPYGRDFADTTRLAQDAITNLVDRQAPGVMDDLRAANQAYRQVGIVRDAVNAARNGSGGDIGTFLPSQLTNAAATNARRFGRTQGTTEQPFLDLTSAAQQVLPSKVPDSGTAGRLAMMALPGALGGAGSGVGYAADGGQGAGTGGAAGLGLAALLALGGTRGGQQILTRALLDRPDFAVRIGNQIYRRQALAGALGAPLLIDGSQ